MKFLVNSAPLFISEDSSLVDAGQERLRMNAHCMLVTNTNDFITGILTKSDLLKGFLDSSPSAQQKLVKSYMSYPVEFIRYKNLSYDLQRLFSDLCFSHYPVIRDPSASSNKANIVGTLCLTEIAQDVIKKSTENRLAQMGG